MTATFKNESWVEISRSKCEIYTRVMWYHRPVTSFNTWKKAEFYSRNYFDMSQENQCFNDKFGS